MAKKKKDDITPQVENQTQSDNKNKTLSNADVTQLANTLLRKNARNINREYKTKRLLIRMAVVIVSFLLLCYGALWISRRVGGNFEISLSNARREISLCIDEDFNAPTDNLTAPIPETMYNTSYTWLPLDTLGSKNGSDNGENYMCYTFYLKNRGNRNLDYYCELSILNIELGLDECIRVMIIRNNTEKFYYAKQNKTTGRPEQVYYYDTHANFEEEEITYTEPFIDINKGFSLLREGLAIDQIDKYSIVIWIEGSDPDTIDQARSGKVQMKLTFTVVQPEGED